MTAPKNIDLEALPADRQSAKALGSFYYREAKPCRKGHESPVRITGSGLCKECLRLRNAAKDPEAVQRHRKEALLRFNERIKTDPEFREKVRARQRKTYKTAPWREKKIAQLAARHAREDVRAKRRLEERQKYHQVWKFDPAYKEAARKRSAAWAKANPAKCGEKVALRRAMRIGATPKWLGAEDRKIIRGLYTQAKVESSASGVPHEVDHIIPLRSELVSGLHVPWNLQVVPRHFNRSKHNRIAVSQ